MTENEMIECYKRAIKIYKEEFGGSGEDSKSIDLYKSTIKLIEEIQQYRAIGTVEECRGCMDILNKEEAVFELAKIAEEWILYHKIGTVEECQEAREKQRSKKPTISHAGPVKDSGKAHCPNCRQDIHGVGRIKHCFYCGQAIDWPE